MRPGIPSLLTPRRMERPYFTDAAAEAMLTHREARARLTVQTVQAIVCRSSMTFTGLWSSLNACLLTGLRGPSMACQYQSGPGDASNVTYRRRKELASSMVAAFGQSASAFLA